MNKRVCGSASSTKKDLNNVNIDDYNYFLEMYKIYYYSEYVPTDGENYWHYVDGVATVW